MSDEKIPHVSVNVQQPGVTITLADIYEKLIVVETKLAPILDPDVGVMAKQKDHESRLRNLERNRWPLPSLAVLVALAALVVPFVGR